MYRLTSRTTNNYTMKHQIVETLLKSANKHYSKKLTASQHAFIQDYYHRLPREDFSISSTEDLITAALKHRKLGAVRKPGETLIDIYNKKTVTHEGDPCTVLNIVTSDKPFLVDSLIILLNSRNLTIHRIIHPVFQVKRSKFNRITSIIRHHVEKNSSQESTESFIQFHIDYMHCAKHDQFALDINAIITKVQTVVTDWPLIREHLLSLAVELETDPKVSPDYSELLRWVENHHFVMLGYCELSLTGNTKKPTTHINKSSALGYMRNADLTSGHKFTEFLPPFNHKVQSPVTISKTRQRSTIHRPAFMDCIIVHRSQGNNNNISCILGLFSAESFIRATFEIPLLKQKAEWILKKSTLRQGSHAYKTLQIIIENLPRESLFQMDKESIFQTTMEILNHQERRKTSVYIHQDQYGHFYSCLVYVPRDLFHSDLRIKIQQYLRQELNGSEVLFNVYFSESILTRLHFIIHTKTGKPVNFNLEKIKNTIQTISRDWNDSLRVRLNEQFDLKQSRILMENYSDTFPGNYRNDFDVSIAVKDIENIEATCENSIYCTLYRRESDHKYIARLKIYSIGKQIPLSDVLPILENLGLRVLSERPYRLQHKQFNDVWIYDFEIVRQDGHILNIKSDGRNLQQTVYRVWCGDCENDGFNQLVLDTGLDWRQVILLRACFKYLRQLRLRYSQEYVIVALKNNRSVVAQLSNLFAQRFDPDLNQPSTKQVKNTIARLLGKVKSLDEDRILHAIHNVITAILRTNYYQKNEDGEFKHYLSFKVDSRSLSRIPNPKPKVEVFVYSPRVEGIHLRGGDVARGGLRWSDRQEDFRTEVLSLLKAQMVKNTVIVPVGSKGGFVPKQLPKSDRDAIIKEAIACYKILIMGMLDLTDNLHANKVIHPNQVVCYDADDPYLVVAADKGTATFSDIANQISQSRNFWLGDAFASGGSFGYDHKKMGITARGAWESIKRHFKEADINIQTTDFTVAGIGDMSGDVFGNGMLLSKHIQLVAAYNHVHIFIDPQPSTARSFNERKRLFNLPRSSWADYNHKLISKGGGVFERTAKSITLTPQIKKLLDTNLSKCSPTELIRLILKMSVDLLWNGGIGTYVKASYETHGDALDKTNDTLRIDSHELRCRVIGEGGNLGITQNGRIEFTTRGGACNTDAIDNSAGVDTSDHEVNIKILLNRAIEDGKITIKQRNQLLAKMEHEVKQLVLRNSYTQTQALSIAASYGTQLIAQHTNAIRVLEQRGLNRALENLPDDNELDRRTDIDMALTRPELAVLLSYSKMDLYQALLKENIASNQSFSKQTETYFPTILRQRFRPQIHSHRLKSEITATHLTNRLVDQMGFSFHLTIQTLTSLPTAEITYAWFAAQEIMQSDQLFLAIEAQDNRIKASLQLELFRSVALMMKNTVLWLLHHVKFPIDIEHTVTNYHTPVKTVISNIDSYISVTDFKIVQDREKRLSTCAVPKILAKRLARISFLPAALEIAGISKASKRTLTPTANAYFELGEALFLRWIAELIEKLPTKNQWHERAKFALKTELTTNHGAITTNIMENMKVKADTALVQKWLSQHQNKVKIIQDTATQLKQHDKLDFAMLSVLMNNLSQLK